MMPDPTITLTKRQRRARRRAHGRIRNWNARKDHEYRAHVTAW